MTRMLIGAGTLAVIGILVAASVVVLDEGKREHAPHLAVTIKGVPPYAYYNRDYEITFEYANQGGSRAEDVTLSAILPRDFTLVGSASRVEEQSVVWHLGGLVPGETGAVTAKLRGTVPDDLTNAVYDLPGYIGHTAFVDGLSIDVALASSSGRVTAQAWADTGVTPDPVEGTVNTITIIKDSVPNDPQDFTFDPGGNCLNLSGDPVTCPDALVINGNVNFTLDNDDPTDPGYATWPDRRTFAVNFSGRINARHSVTELLEEGWEITNISCTPAGVPGVAEFAFAKDSITTGPDYDPAFNIGDDTVWFNITNGQGFLSCTFTNTRIPVNNKSNMGRITVHKETSTDSNVKFDFELLGGPFATLDESFSLGSQESKTFVLPRRDYTIREIAREGWSVGKIDCGRVGQGNAATGSVTFFLLSEQFVDCTFSNVEDPAKAAVATPTVTGQPNVSGALGGILSGPRREPTVAIAGVVATTAPPTRTAGAATISPPSTGGGGLR